MTGRNGPSTGLALLPAHPPEAKVNLDTPIEQVPAYHEWGSGPAKLFAL